MVIAIIYQLMIIQDNPFMHGHVRKISMSIILNDNFEGGAFEFATYGKEECAITPIEAKSRRYNIFLLRSGT